MSISPIEEIKNRLDIVDVIGSYLKLQKTGANFRAICPFHSEKKPSFFVSPTRQIWHCFGCGSGYNIFDFVMKIEGIEFGDALRILAQRAGVELKPISKKLETERSRLYEICEFATRFFEKQLWESRSGQEAKEYLLRRQISEESIREWHLGYSPESWQGLTNFLISKGYKKEEIEKTGLAIKKNSQDIYDRFRGRIIFPIFDLNSQVIGFSGRVFKDKDKDNIAKYINTPNTLLYDKSRILYGLDRAKLEIRRKNSCILVEGYTDVILAHQNNFKNVVAISGSALTPWQLKILKRYSENLILSFDMDIAGDSATKRGIDLAQSLGFDIKILTLGEQGLDPADLISQNPKKWEEEIENAKSILDFYFQSAFNNNDSKSPEGKKQISKVLLPIIKRIPNQIEKSFWIQKLARNLEVREEVVVEELKKTKLEEEIYGLEREEIINLPQKSRQELLEERLLTLLIKFPQNLNQLEKGSFSFLPKTKEILAFFKKKSEKIPAESEDYFNYLNMKAEMEEINEGDALLEVQACLKEIQSQNIKEQLRQISQEIKKAEEEKNAEKIKGLIQEFQKIANQTSIL